MKFTINIECTPEEARSFMGLPDPAKMQEHMFKAFQDQFPELAAQMPDGMHESMTKNMEAWTQMQNAFWAQMMSPYGGKAEQADKK